MGNARTPNPKLVAIRDMLVDAVHEGLSNSESKERKKASFLGVAVAVLKLHGGLEEIQTPDEKAADRLSALRASLVDRDGTPLTLPFLDPSPMADEHEDDDTNEEKEDF
jgi:hypothetical protein